MEAKEFEELKDYIVLKTFPEELTRDQKKNFKKKVKKFKYDAVTNKFFHKTKNQVCNLYFSLFHLHKHFLFISFSLSFTFLFYFFFCILTLSYNFIYSIL
jgi:hypothetical protein